MNYFELLYNLILYVDIIMQCCLCVKHILIVNARLENQGNVKMSL